MLNILSHPEVNIANNYAEDALYKIKSLLSIFSNFSNDIILHINNQGTIIRANAEQVFDVSVCGKSWTRFLDKTSIEKDKKALNEAVSEKRNEYTLALNIAGKNVKVTSFILYNEIGSVDFIIKKIQGLSGLDKQIQKFESVFESLETLSESTCIINSKKEFVYINKSFEKLYGYKKEEIIGKKPSILKSGYYSSVFYKKMISVLHENNIWEAEIWNKARDGNLIQTYEVIRLISINNENYYIVTFIPRDEQRKKEMDLDYSAHHDMLTGLPNRKKLNKIIEDEIEENRLTNNGFSLLFLDLDKFKQINDTYGHKYGDYVLIETAKRIRSCIRKEDFVSRLGGDEFVIVIKNKEKEMINRISNLIIKTISEAYIIENNTFYIGVSIGVSLFPEDGNDLEEIMKSADFAMYQTKENGRNGVSFFNTEKHEKSVKVFHIQNILKEETALRENIFPVFQPIYDTQKDRVCGFEILCRITHNGEYLQPVDFIPVAEGTALINELTAIIIEKSIPIMDEILKKDKSVYFSFNFTIKQITYNDELFDLFGSIPKKNIMIEITESVFSENHDDIILSLKLLSQKGFKIAIDDFGTGFSSLSRIITLPIDKLKIDKSFVSDMISNEKSMLMIVAIINIAKVICVDVIAEGVETIAEKELLRINGCNLHQGYLYSKPIDSTMLTNAIKLSTNGKCLINAKNGVVSFEKDEDDLYI
jgi:diguanylate cyclase (GGDEF)-like protein/PAS domain S-box-containing protein